MKDAVTAFIGICQLIIAVTLSVVLCGAITPIAIGAGLMCVVLVGGQLSAGGDSPVALSSRPRRRLPLRHSYACFLAQVAGAAAGGVIAVAVVAYEGSSAVANGPLIVVELVFMASLGLAVFNATTSNALAANWYCGLAIGFTPVVAAFSAEPAASAFSHALAIGPVLLAGEPIVSATRDWVFVAGPVLGVILVLGHRTSSASRAKTGTVRSRTLHGCAARFRRSRVLRSRRQPSCDLPGRGRVHDSDGAT